MVPTEEIPFSKRVIVVVSEQPERVVTITATSALFIKVKE